MFLKEGFYCHAEDRCRGRLGSFQISSILIWSYNTQASIQQLQPCMYNLPVCDCMLANISQKLSYGRDSGMRSLAHTGNIFLACVTASFFFFFFLVCPHFLVLSLRDSLFFKWRRRNISFANPTIFAVSPRKLHLTDHMLLRGQRNHSR